MHWNPFRASRREPVVLAVLMAISLQGCMPTTEVPTVSTSPALSGTPTTRPPTVSTSLAPTGAAGQSFGDACPPDLPSILVDEQLRYRLCMPDGWRDLGLDRSAWIEAFGVEVTELEVALRSGRIDHVVASLPPSEHLDFAPLVIDSSQFQASDSLEDRRDAFLDGNVELGAVLLSSEIVDLGGVRAARAILDVSDMEGVTRDGLRILYLVPITSELLFISFTATAESAREYEPIFDAIADSIDLGFPAT